MVNESTSSTTVYEFVSGQTYFVEYITQRQRQASEFENLSIKVLDMATYEFTTTEHTIALTDLVIDAEREADGFHSRFLLTVTGPSLGPFDMMTDMMAAYLVNAESSFNIGIAVIGSDPEPPVPEEPDFVYSDAVGADKYEFESGVSYRIVFVASNLVSIPLSDPRIMVVDETTEDISWPDGYEFILSDLVMPTGMDGDGYSRTYFTLSITGPSLDDCYIVFNEGTYVFRAEIIGSDPEPPVPEDI